MGKIKKELTLEIAKQFLDKTESIELSQFTSITDAAGQALSNHIGQLRLEGLTSFSEFVLDSFVCNETEIFLSDILSERLNSINENQTNV